MNGQARLGAEVSDWNHLDLILGLGSDCLPVVSNSSATIAPGSSLKALGKVPSRYNGQRQVIGIKDWPSRFATDAEVVKWSNEPDYGIALITRLVRAIDVDIGDTSAARVVENAILEHVGVLPTRRRGNSGKLLLAFKMPGDYPKRVIKTAHGLIEALMSGQQFICCGTHPSGARYEWAGGLPYDIPTLTPEQFESLWSMLEERFAIEPSVTSNASVKPAKLADALANDSTAAALAERGLVLKAERDGRLHIACPFADEHTSDGAESATTYFPAKTNGFEVGHFNCLHAHCDARTDNDFLTALGLAHDMRDDFEAMPQEAIAAEIEKRLARFAPVPDSEFKSGKPLGWLVKKVLPMGGIGVIFGPSGSGKSFFVLDLVGSIARGLDWCGRRTKPGKVVYIAAEGASGFRNRINAYCESNEIDNMGIYVIAAAPNFTEAKDIIDLTNSIRELGPVDLVVVDTLAQVSPGANENSGEDMGRVLGHCGTLKQETGAMVLLIHHAGKDLSKGARGWSGIKAGLDVEIEIGRSNDDRTATISKMRDGEGEGDQYGFKLTTVPIGMDEDGDVISSCVVEHGAVVAKKPKPRKLGQNENIVWSVVQGMWRELSGTPLSIDRILDETVERTPFDPKQGPKDNRRTNHHRALDKLVAKGMLAIVDDAVIVVGNECFTVLHEAT